jgi:hypothetical protein
VKESDRNRWIHHIQHLRAEHDTGLSDAQRIALADTKWRRWVEHQINTDDRCRRMALRHIREAGVNALIQIDDDRLRVVGDDRA